MWCVGVWSIIKKQKEVISVVENEQEEREERLDRYKNREDIRENIRAGLMDQLQERNVLEPHFTDLVNDYVSMWDVKCELIYDIETKGVSIRYQNGQNQYGHKRNDSVAELNRVNGQMLTILRELGLKAEAKVADDDNDSFDL